jgi:spore coat protein CotH
MKPASRLPGQILLLMLILAVAIIGITLADPFSGNQGTRVTTEPSLTSSTAPSTVNSGTVTDATLTPAATSRPLEEKSELAGEIFINEVLASNRTVLNDEDAESSDWIEIFNASGSTVDLSGCYLSNEPDRPFLWKMPDLKLQPGEYMTIFASGKDRAGDPLHTNFTLKRSQDTLVFRDRDGRIIDSLAFSKNLPDISFGRSPDHPETLLYFTRPTPGGRNDPSGWPSLQLPKAAAGIAITEVMNKNAATLKDQDGEYADWIEIFNPGPDAVNLRGFGLSDGGDLSRRWLFPDMDIQPGEHLVVFASGKNLRDPSNPLHTDFKLNMTGEPVLLYDPFGRILGSVRVGRLGEDISFGRESDTGRWLYFAKPTPGTANGADGFLGYADQPELSAVSGFYDSSLTVAMTSSQPGAEIRYTLDGSEPTARSSRYESPIEISRTTMVRAVAFKDGYRPGKTATSTYFVNVSSTLPVVSIVMDQGEFDDPTYGIYSMGPNASSTFPYFGANFHSDTEPAAVFQFFEPDGKLGFQMDIGIQIFGGWTRAYNQKSFALFARNKYESDVMSYPFFSNKDLTQFRQLVLRTAGQDVLTSKIRDILATRLMSETSLDYQGYRFVSLYINGRYWGVYSIREKVNRYFIHYNHGIDDLDTIDILMGNGSIRDGDNADYKALLAYIGENDLSQQECYEHVKSVMDVENYMDYIIMMMYSANIDSGNIRFWRERTEGGKFRWFVYDMDLGFGAGATVTHDTVWFMINPSGTGAGGSFSTRLINGLLKNDEFRSQFIERFAWHLKNTFATDRVISIIDELAAEIEPEMAMNVERWERPESVAAWKSYVDVLRNFARRRPAIIVEHLKQHFNLSAEEIALFQS